MPPMSLQRRHAPESRCFGCGPANPHGLHVESRPEGEDVVADWKPQPHHEAYRGAVSGGIIGTLLDCHSNWTAALALMQRGGTDDPPACVTAEYAVRFLRPTPADRPLRLQARAVLVTDRRATVEADLSVDGTVTATCRGTFIAVGADHPAYDRWQAGG